MRISLKRIITLGCITALAQTLTPATAQTDTASLVTRLKSYRFGGDKTLFDDVAQAVAESRMDPSRRVQLARGFASILGSEDVSFDAKQLACRELAFVGGEEQVGALVPLLKVDYLAHYALMALARIPGKPVDDSLLKELATTTGHTRIEIMDVLAERRNMAAIPAIAAQLKSTSTETAEGAAASLGKLGTARAVEELGEAYETATPYQKVHIANAMLRAGGRMAASGDTAGAVKVFDLLNREAPAPMVQAAAFRGLVLARGEQALPMVIRALAEDGSVRQLAAAKLLREMTGPKVTAALAAQLPRMSHRAQVLGLEALSDRGDRSATAAVNRLASNEDPAVRAAALRALGSVGDASAIPLLLKVAATGAKDEQEAARDSLTQIHATGADESLVAAIGQGDSAVRIEAIKAVGSRGTASGKPLLDAAAGSDRAVSVAALRVLRDSASPDQLPDLVSLLLAGPSGDRFEAIEAVSEVARRGKDDNQRTAVIIARLNSAVRPADRADLLIVLSQVGGPTALRALRKEESETGSEARSTALRLLSEWPTDEPMADLLRAYKASTNSTEKAIALRGYIRMIGMNEQRTQDEALALYKQAAAGSTGPAENRLILSGVSKLGSLDALEFARGYMADSAVRPEAELAVVEISKATLAAYPVRTREALEPIARDSSNEAVKTRARDSVALLDKLKDFVIAWEVSPPYQKEGADYSRLFEMPFAPEEANQQVAWRLMPIGTSAEQPWLLDLFALYPGEQKVAYLRTAVWSEAAREMVLELGSDDGVKAWWNGQVVLADNTARAVAPGQEKVKVQAKPGWNQLLLKVTQNNQGWGAVARVLNPDGAPASGLRFAVPSAAK
jgi:HEAT repeat protein